MSREKGCALFLVFALTMAVAPDAMAKKKKSSGTGEPSESGMVSPAWISPEEEVHVPLRGSIAGSGLHQRLPRDESVEALKSPPAFQRALLDFYGKRGRDLPWRRTRDPYAIWISEVMLQQTQVQTVIPRFAKFLRQFPTVASLAAADERTVCEAWAGLGYYRRARNLHKAARMIVAEWHGEVPDTEATLRQLPGVGAYTAAAIASIAFAQKTPAVDG